MRVDEEIDYHGFTAAAMRADLDRRRSSRSWRGKQRVRVIHGTGEVLSAALRSWCQKHGVAWGPDGANPGSVILHPSREASLGTTPDRLPPRGKRTVARAPATASPPNPEDQALFEAEMRRLGS